MRKRVLKVLLGVAIALLILLAPVGLIREETWQYQNAAGVRVQMNWGYRLIGMGPPALDPELHASRVTGQGEGWFGLFRFSVDEPYAAK